MWQTTTSNSTVSGNLHLEFPGVITGSSAGPILFFEIYPQGSTFKGQEMEVSNNKNLESISSTSNPEPIIWPNPSENKIFVNLGSEFNEFSSWNVTDLNGKILMSGSVNQQEFEISLNPLERGIYYMVLLNNEDSKTLKVIKQ